MNDAPADAPWSRVVVELALALGAVEHGRGGGDRPNPGADEPEAGDVEAAEARIGPFGDAQPADKRVPPALVPRPRPSLVTVRASEAPFAPPWA